MRLQRSRVGGRKRGLPDRERACSRSESRVSLGRGVRVRLRLWQMRGLQGGRLHLRCKQRNPAWRRVRHAKGGEQDEEADEMGGADSHEKHDTTNILQRIGAWQPPI